MLPIALSVFRDSNVQTRLLHELNVHSLADLYDEVNEQCFCQQLYVCHVLLVPVFRHFWLPVTKSYLQLLCNTAHAQSTFFGILTHAHIF